MALTEADRQERRRWYRDVYLPSPEWQDRRKQAIERANGRCAHCSATERLQVHHVTYRNIGNERPEDLLVLCRRCHRIEHGLIREHRNKIRLSKPKRNGQRFIVSSFNGYPVPMRGADGDKLPRRKQIIKALRKAGCKLPERLADAILRKFLGDTSRRGRRICPRMLRPDRKYVVDIYAVQEQSDRQRQTSPTTRNTNGRETEKSTKSLIDQCRRRRAREAAKAAARHESNWLV